MKWYALIVTIICLYLAIDKYQGNDLELRDHTIDSLNNQINISISNADSLTNSMNYWKSVADSNKENNAAIINRIETNSDETNIYNNVSSIAYITKDSIFTKWFNRRSARRSTDSNSTE